MSWQATTWAANVRVGDPVLKLLLLVLGNFATEDGECWYSQKRISYDSEIPERTLRRKMSQLVEAGLIEVQERRREDGSRMTNFVRLLIEQPATVAACSESASGQNSKRPKTGVTSGQKPGSPAATMVASKESINNQELSVLDSTPTPGPDDGWPDDFLDQFWTAFPPYRREGKRKVGEKLARLRRDRVVPWTELIGAVRRFAATNPGEFAPAPMVWLNGERWDREYGNRGGANETNRNGGGKTGFSGLAAKLRQGIREQELADRGHVPEDLGPLDGR